MSEYIQGPLKINEVREALEFVPEELKPLVAIMLDTLNIEDVEQRFNATTKDTLEFTYECIEIAMKIRPRRTERLFSLMALLIQKYGINENKIRFTNTLDILAKRELLPTKVTEYYRPQPDIFNVKGVEKVIIDDDVDSLRRFMCRPDYSPDVRIQFFMSNDFLKSRNACLQAAAKFGSVKCFRHLIAVGGHDTKNLNKYAVAGGNTEIIHIIEQQGISFDDCFNVSLTWYQEEVSAWLIVHYNCDMPNLLELFNLNCIREVYFCLVNGIHSPWYVFEMLLHCVCNVPSLKIIMCIHQYAAANDDGVPPTPLSEIFPRTVEKGVLEVVKYIVDNFEVDVNCADSDHITPLIAAVEYNHFDIVKYLVEECGAEVDACDDNLITPLHFAATSGNTEIMQYLIEKGADINHIDIDGRTPLVAAIIEERDEAVKYLIDKGANINIKDEQSVTLLHYAAANGHIKLVAHLIDNGLDVNAVDKDGHTALIDAVTYGHVEVAKYLIQHGATFKYNVTGEPPLIDSEIGLFKLIRRAATTQACSSENAKEVAMYLVEVLGNLST